MPRAARGPFRAARRTNWIGEVQDGTTVSVAAGTTTVQQIAAGQWSSEIEAYTDPTIVRVRGQILVSPGFAQSEASESVYCFAGIYVGPNNAPAGLSPHTGDQSSDRTLWTGAIGYTKRGIAISGSGAGLSLAMLTLPPMEIDSKAMRRIGDEDKVWLYVSNPIAAAVSLSFTYQIRLLVKE